MDPMLPFTKRPVRNEESEDSTRSPPSAPPSSVLRSDAPKAAGPVSQRPAALPELPRGELHSENEEEMTNIIQSRPFAGPIGNLPNVSPAAGRPASVPPPRPNTLRPP